MMNKNKRTLYQQYERAGILRDIYLWIDKSLDINYPNRPISDYSYMAETENVEEHNKKLSLIASIPIPTEKLSILTAKPKINNCKMPFNSIFLSSLNVSTII